MSDPLFRGELQLLRWSETSNQGATITFQLSDVRDLDAFKDLTLAKKGMTGQRIAAIMQQVEDDVESAPATVAPKARAGELCVMACTFCADERFQYWVGTQCGAGDTEAEAKTFILGMCGIESRKELDSNPVASIRFHKDIREPYLAWRKQP